MNNRGKNRTENLRTSTILFTTYGNRWNSLYCDAVQFGVYVKASQNRLLHFSWVYISSIESCLIFFLNKCMHKFLGRMHLVYFENEVCLHCVCASFVKKRNNRFVETISTKTRLLKRKQNRLICYNGCSRCFTCYINFKNALLYLYAYFTRICYSSSSHPFLTWYLAKG